MSPEEKIIHDIRKKYLVDGELDAESEKVREGVKALHDIMQKAVDRLSGDLYAKDSHFVLELLQNADDNHYEKSVIPSLRLFWDEAKQAIEVRNNERGFTEKEVWALCAIGNSTKAGSLEGYIGEKGIGFKSVFKVADRVYVASNGYRFVFDASLPLGMIAPKWVPEHEFPTHCEEGETTFFLSLKNVGVNKDALKEQCQKIHPYLLLFLKKVRRLELDIAGNVNAFEREGMIPNVSIRETSWSSDRERNVKTRHPRKKNIYSFLVGEQEFTKPAEVNDEKRNNVTRTKVVIAFPLEADGKPVTTQQDVYAFLPLRSHGFKFVIQADFLLSTSREDVIEDSLWNRFLRNSITDAFMTAQELFKFSETISHKLALVSYIPFTDDVANPFFRVVAFEIVKRMRNEPFILSCAENWRAPASILHLSRALKFRSEEIEGDHAEIDNLEALIPNDEVLRILKKEYIHDLYCWETHSKLLKLLGSQTFDFNCLVTCLQSLNYHAINHYGTIDLMVQWHRTVLKYLAAEYKQWSDHFSLAELAKLPIYFLQTERITALRDGDFFLPPKDSTLFALDRSILFLHLKSLTGSSRKFLTELKVKEPQIVDLAEVVLALYESHASAIWSVRSQEELFRHVQFLQQHVDKLNDDFRMRLKKNIRLMNEHGQYTTSDQLYIKAKAYNLKKVLPSSMSAVHDQYLTPAQGNDLHRENKWVSFLATHCGVNRAVSLQDGKLPVWLTQKLAGDTNGQQCIELLAMMAQFWAELYEPAVLKNQMTFCTQLSKMRVPCIGGEVQRLNQTALRTTNIYSRFKDSLIYIELGDPDDKKWGFLQYLGVSVAIDDSSALKALEGMSNRGDNNIEVARNYYKLLEVYFEQASDTIKASFKSKPLIMVKGAAATDPVKWCKSDEVLWSGDKNVFPDEVFLMESLPKCETFFTEYLKIRSADVTDLKKMINQLPKELPPGETADARSIHMAHVYRYLDKWMRTTKPWEHRWLMELPIFWVENSRTGWFFFIENNGQIFINDDEALAKEYKDSLTFLSVQQNELPRMKKFIKSQLPPIQRLSKILPEDTHPIGNYVVDEKWTDVIRKCVPLCAKVLYAENSKKMETLANNGVFKRASNHLTVLRADEIHFVYLIGTVRRKLKRSVHFQQEPTCIKILMSRNLDGDDEETELCNIMLEIFDPTSAKLNNLFGRILKPDMNTYRLTKFAQSLKILDLPSSYSYADIFGDAASTSSPVEEGNPVIVVDQTKGVSEVPPQEMQNLRTQSGSTANPDSPVKIRSSNWMEQAKNVLNKQPEVLHQVMPDLQIPSNNTASANSPGKIRSSNLMEQAKSSLSKQSEAPRQTASESRSQSGNTSPNSPIQKRSPVTVAMENPARNLSSKRPNMLNHQPANSGSQSATSVRFPASTESQSENKPTDYNRPSLDDELGTSLGTNFEPPDEQDIHEVGLRGEAFVYHHYEAILPDFGLANWISHLRDEYFAKDWNGFPPVISSPDITQADREVACDFVYKDTKGVLSEILKLPAMPATIRKFFLEVKTTTMKGSESFHLSMREWEHAQLLSSFEDDGQAQPSRVYVIIRVGNLKTTPSIVKELVDPWALFKLRRMKIEPTDWIVSSFM